MESRRCAACGECFQPRPQIRKQTYCQAAACQRERRRRWQQAKRRSDSDYRANQREAQQSWGRRHPEYWRAYRNTHPVYLERNRIKQRERDQKRRVGRLAKMDVKTREFTVPSGTYRLSPIDAADLAKMDAWTVEITVLSSA
jgi:hypothetical protein